MTIFFQIFIERVKLNLLLLAFIVIFQSCEIHKSGESDKIAMNVDSYVRSQNIVLDSNKDKSTVPSRFLDTIKLKEIGIAYRKIESNKFFDKWLLSLTDTIPKSKQILGLTYNIVTSIDDDNNYVLFQLDSLIIHLSDKTQSFGFNEDGPYFHSYESLIKPNIIFDDYNFDGIIDFSVQSGGSGTNESRCYHIFNVKRKNFNKAISMANASFDKSNKLVYQSWHMSAATGGKCTFRFTKADTLIMIRNGNKKYIDSLDAYVKEIELLQEDGTYSLTIDTIKWK